MASISPRFETADPILFAGLRATFAYGDAPAGIPALWMRFAPILPVPGQVGFSTFGVMTSGGVPSRSFEYMCAAEVSTFEGLPEILDRLRAPAGRYAVFTHEGHVSAIRGTWDKVWDWGRTSGVKQAPTPDFERYGEGFNPRTGLGDMEIWIPLAE